MSTTTNPVISNENILDDHPERNFAHSYDKAKDSNKISNKIVVFVKQDQSLFSKLYNNNGNIRIIIELFVLASVLFVAREVILDSIRATRLQWKALETFGGLSMKSLADATVVIIGFHIVAFLVQPLFQVWVYVRKVATPLIDVVFLLLYTLVVILSFVYVLAHLPSVIETNVCTRVIISTEQIRLCMKSYAFIRENAYKVLYPWNKDDTTGPAVWYKGQMSPKVGSFNQYCYFLFAPTLLYRDHYPRSDGPFSLKRFFTHLSLFVFSVVMLIQFVGMQQVDDFHWLSVVLSILKGVPFGILYALYLNIIFMHSWMNIFCDILKFGDRKFYEEWWHSTSYGQFYRKWNIIPYHFNNQYIYRDMRKITSSKFLASFLMLLMSSVVHEYVLAFSFGHAVPLVTLLFAGIGTTMIVVGVGSFIMNVSLSVGIFLLMWHMTVEAQARRVCSREETLIDLFYPRLIECILKHSS